MMNWSAGLSRFIHRFSQAGAPSGARLGAQQTLNVQRPALRLGSGLAAEREERLLPALICALFDVEGSAGAWPPKRVTPLLDLAGLDRVTSGLHLCGTSFPSSFRRGPPSRAIRQAILQEGLFVLEEGLLAETGRSFEALSPLLRGYALAAFERGELGFPQEAAERFMDCLVETATFAFLNFESELGTFASEVPDGAWRS